MTDFFLFYFFDFLILVSGLTGNTLFFMISFLGKKLRKKPTTVYFLSMSIADTLTLMSILKYYLNESYQVIDHSQALCKLTEYYTISTSAISAWHLVIISFDRMIFIVYPHRFRFFNNKISQLALIAAIYMVNLIFYVSVITNTEFVNVHSLNRTNLNDGNLECLSHCSFNHKMGTLRIIQLVQSSVFPFVLMLSFSSFTVYSISQSRKKFKAHISTRRLSTRDIQFAMTSIFLNLTFLCLTFPQIFMEMLEEYHVEMEKSLTANIVKRILTNFNYCEYAVLFLASYIFNTNFKREFSDLLTLRVNKTSSVGT